jgi:cell division protein FtsW
MGLRFEPSEFLKVSFPFCLAILAVWNWSTFNFWRYLAAGLVIGAPLAMVLGQPDFGTFAICLIVLLGTLFSLGLAWRYVFAGAGLVLASFYVLIVNVPYRMARFTAFFDPWADPEAKGFQVIQSMLSFYSGGLTGAGVGQGQGKLFFLPAAHTDFTAAVLGEEMGFLGVFILLVLFGFVILRGLQITARARQPQHQVIALGLTLTFAMGFLFNFGVAFGLLPTKGLALPFISYGGSSLVANAILIGLLLNIDRQRLSTEKHGFKGIRIS